MKQTRVEIAEKRTRSTRSSRQNSQTSPATPKIDPKVTSSLDSSQPAPGITVIQQTADSRTALITDPAMARELVENSGKQMEAEAPKLVSAEKKNRKAHSDCHNSRKRPRSSTPESSTSSRNGHKLWQQTARSVGQSEAFDERHEGVDSEMTIPFGDRVAYIHVGEGGEADLEAQLTGAENLDIQILEEEDLPDIDETDIIHGLDHTGTTRDYVDDRHRCTINCPIGCQGHLRPNEIIVYESFKFEGSLRGRKRYKGRIIYNNRRQSGESSSSRVQASGSRESTSQSSTSSTATSASTNKNQERLPHSKADRKRNSENMNSYITENMNGAITPKMPSRLEMLLDMPRASKLTQIKNGWNAEDRSLNIFVKDEESLTFHRHPVAQSTDCIRGKVSYERGLHVFELDWPARHRGTHAVVGVATADAPLHSIGYQSLVGSNEHSWGWDLGRKKTYHKSQSSPGTTYPTFADDNFVVPDKFLMVLDMDEGSVSFVVNGKWLGVAQRGLRGKTLFPIVSAVWGHCEVAIKYIGGLDSDPLPLVDLCRTTIRKQIGKPAIEKGVIDQLVLPKAIKNYLLIAECFS